MTNDTTIKECVPTVSLVVTHADDDVTESVDIPIRASASTPALSSMFPLDSTQREQQTLTVTNPNRLRFQVNCLDLTSSSASNLSHANNSTAHDDAWLSPTEKIE